jgi:hypothetical protein
MDEITGTLWLLEENGNLVDLTKDDEGMSEVKKEV